MMEGVGGGVVYVSSVWLACEPRRDNIDGHHAEQRRGGGLFPRNFICFGRYY